MVQPYRHDGDHHGCHGSVSTLESMRLLVECAWQHVSRVGEGNSVAPFRYPFVGRSAIKWARTKHTGTVSISFVSLNLPSSVDSQTLLLFVLFIFSLRN